MSLINMKKSEGEKKEESMPSVMDRESYPYGLKVHINEECFEKLGLGEVPKVGTKMMMLAVVEVTDIHKSEKGDDKAYYSMGLQITDMALNKKEMKEEKSTSQVLYGSEA